MGESPSFSTRRGIAQYTNSMWPWKIKIMLRAYIDFSRCLQMLTHISSPTLHLKLTPWCQVAEGWWVLGAQESRREGCSSRGLVGLCLSPLVLALLIWTQFRNWTFLKPNHRDCLCQLCQNVFVNLECPSAVTQKLTTFPDSAGPGLGWTESLTAAVPPRASGGAGGSAGFWGWHSK